jgi:hypothetical protein
MIFIWENRSYPDHRGYILRKCPCCGQIAPFAVIEQKTKLTVYWIPTLSYEEKYYFQCGTCGETLELSQAQQSSLMPDLMTQQQLSAMVCTTVN